MGKCVVWTTPDGKLAVTRVAEGLDIGKTVAKTLFEMNRTTGPKTHFNPAVHSPSIIPVELDESELPYHIIGNGDPAHGMCLSPDCHDRYFRDAIVWKGASPVCDMPKARVIHMNRIRQIRSIPLEALDVPYIKSLEAGDIVQQQAIAAQKRVLRDIPQNFDLSKYRVRTTLKAVWPAELER